MFQKISRLAFSKHPKLSHLRSNFTSK